VRLAHGTLPLGIDIGTTRVRIAQLDVHRDAARLQRMIAFDLPETSGASPAAESIGRTIAQRLAELAVKERRCVCALGEEEATIRPIVLPPMPQRERSKAARYEASRLIEYPIGEALVRVQPLDPARNLIAIGIARRAALERKLAIVRAAGLRAVCLDHDGFALRRVAPRADAAIDIGLKCARFYALRSATPFGLVIPGGSIELTHALERSLSIDFERAERRKRTLGLAGAAEGELTAFSAAIGQALLVARKHGVGEIQQIVLVGNGARLPGLRERLERDTGCTLEIGAEPPVAASAYPSDVGRAGAPDWSLSIGLALWNAILEHVA
jgi:Tfp pilus assembly PilM family ATPase